MKNIKRKNTDKIPTFAASVIIQNLHEKLAHSLKHTGKKQTTINCRKIKSKIFVTQFFYSFLSISLIDRGIWIFEQRGLTVGVRMKDKIGLREFRRNQTSQEIATRHANCK